ncbi:MAG: excinuclease ABC subunit UvrA, partial [Planctomycetota bacterium]|nr:excinuclease ABC subunit UvrA [Planctomycetota bacterium]
LRDDAGAVRVRGHTIAHHVHIPIDRLGEKLRAWKLDRRERKIAGELVREVQSRVGFLLDVGLDYLTLHRGARTLSGGESQRIRLAAQLGSGLCGVLYVLDEPTIGLHPRDNLRLIKALHRLRDLGNTLLVVEHDRDVIASSDYLCDFGPRAGRHGGRIVAEGTPKQIEPVDQSVTAGYIQGTKTIAVPTGRRPVLRKNGEPYVNFLKILGARENNLNAVDLELPLGVFTAVTGPSGSGKSSLIDSILYPALARRLHRARTRPGRHDKIEGVRFIDKVIQVDQSPLGNSPSSNPATYTGAFDLIRKVFSEIPEAAERRFTARTFSFNVAGGRCETCEGSGQLCVEMHFLPDVYVPCDECNSRRYNQDVLEVKLHGKSIADVLEMQCGDAVELFANYPKIAGILQTLCDVGLDYLTLGQAAPTLSGGEAQRVKLASELSRPMTGNTLYLLDEPTTGLHFDDIDKLLSVLQRLVDLGNTVVVIEHNLDVIKCADWIIDMGPGAGVHGGELVFAGTPEALALEAKSKRGKKTGAARSATATFVKQALQEKGLATARKRQAWTASTQAATNPTKKSVAKNAKAAASQASTATNRSLAGKKSPPKKSSRTMVTKAKSASKGPLTTEERSTSKAKSRTLDPWRALGRRWHSLQKGFPRGTEPEWPLEIVDRIFELLEQVAGDDSLEFDQPNKVQVKPNGRNQAWAEIETKTPDSLKVTLAGPPEAVDMEQFSALGINGPVDASDQRHTRVTLNLTKLQQVRSRKLKSFLKRHLEKSFQ